MQNVLEKKQYQYLKMIEEKENQLKKLKQQEEIERIKKQNENKVSPVSAGLALNAPAFTQRTALAMSCLPPPYERLDTHRPSDTPRSLTLACLLNHSQRK